MTVMTVATAVPTAVPTAATDDDSLIDIPPKGAIVGRGFKQGLETDCLNGPGRSRTVQ